MAQPSGGAANAKDAEELEATRMLDSKIDAAEWKLELERVAPQVRRRGAERFSVPEDKTNTSPAA